MLAARKGNSNDTKTEAILRFARTLVNNRGQVSDADMQALISSGISQEEIAEVIGHVGLNILTNYFNNTAKTEIAKPRNHRQDFITLPFAVGR